MGETVVRLIGRAALAAIAVSGAWQGMLPWLDARGLTRFAREIASVTSDERRATSLGWALRRWTALTVAPLALTLAAASALGGLDAAPGDVAARIALPAAIAAINLLWHLVTTGIASRRVERARGEGA